MKEKSTLKDVANNYLTHTKIQKGITLIALVVTIVLLLILSGVTINLLLGENEIIRTAQDAKNTWEGAIANEQESIQNLANELNSIMNDNGQSGDDNLTKPVDITTVTEIVQKEEGQKATDIYGNIVVVPKGFKVIVSEGTTVPEGIVIEDVNGNQFVWIPVGTVHKDSNSVNDIIIQLGRYAFDSDTENDIPDGTPTPIQLAYIGDAKNYTIEVEFGDVIEVPNQREGKIDTSNHLNDLNATAQDLAGFVESVRKNGGYYIARYEASYGSGNNITDWKPLSKISTDNSENSMNYLLGTLWTHVSQLDASKICQNMYPITDNTVGVRSDLMNSYAWDTALVFIQEMGHSNYANKTDKNGTLKNTGKTEDEVCNIFDMGANLLEWTTEYCTYIDVDHTYTDVDHAYPCIHRGGFFKDREGYITGGRNVHLAEPDKSIEGIGFRPILYLK